MVEHQRIERQVASHPLLVELLEPPAELGFGQALGAPAGGESFDPEVDRVCASTYGRAERRAAAGRSQDFGSLHEKLV